MEKRTVDDDTLITKWMQELAATPLAAPPLVDAQILLWKAQAWRRLDQQQQITRPLDTGERLQMVGGSVAAVALMVWLTAVVPQVWTVPSFILAILVSIVLLITAAALMVWNVRRVSEQ